MAFFTIPAIDFSGTPGLPEKISAWGVFFQVGTGVGETGVRIVVPGDVCGINVVIEGVGYYGEAGSGVGTCDVTVEGGTGGCADSRCQGVVCRKGMVEKE